MLPRLSPNFQRRIGTTWGVRSLNSHFYLQRVANFEHLKKWTFQCNLKLHLKFV